MGSCCTIKFHHIVTVQRPEIRPNSIDNIKVSANLLISKKYSPIEESYLILREIGRGSFGQVMYAQHRETEAFRAIKIIPKQPHEFGASIDKFCEEVKILSSIDHPNVVQIYEFYEDNTNLYLVTEYIEGGPLHELIREMKKLPEEVACNIVRQLLSAIKYCHEKKIVHRDLKLENVLLDAKSVSANVKVIDFGLSTLMTTNQRLTACMGSSFYMAPEVINGDYDEKCDIWSCGVILYSVLSGKLPFTGLNSFEVYHKAMQGNPPFAVADWRGISSEAVSLINKMVCVDPRHRITAAAALEEKWFTMWTTSQPISVVTLKSLCSFNAPEKLQHAVLTVIAAHLGTSEEAKQLGEQFRSMDQDLDGRLSKTEIYRAYATFGNTLTLSEVSRILASIDINGSGYIDFTEFLMACMRNENFSSEVNLKYAFSLFDIDNSRSISATEIRRVLGREVIASEEVWEEIIRKFDENQDGVIDFEEFRAMIQRVLR
jgi:calcium-dependent protein kinase